MSAEPSITYPALQCGPESAEALCDLPLGNPRFRLRDCVALELVSVEILGHFSFRHSSITFSR